MKKCKLFAKTIFACMVFSLVAMTSLSAQAEAPNWDDIVPSRIKQIYIADYWIEVILEDQEHNNLDCDDRHKFMLHRTSDSNSSNYEIKAQALLTAYRTGQKVRVVWDMKEDTCFKSIVRFIILN